MSDYESDDEPTVADEIVLNKYKLAGEIVHSRLLFIRSYLYPSCLKGTHEEMCAGGKDNRNL